MRINLTSVLVSNQEEALRFYTETLGFVTRQDVPMGEYRWLTVVSPEGSGDVELLLEPMGHPAARPFQQALYASGVPATSFASDDIHAEHARLSARGVVFRSPPTAMGPVTVATFDDTCGNRIQLHPARARAGAPRGAPARGWPGATRGSRRRARSPARPGRGRPSAWPCPGSSAGGCDTPPARWCRCGA